MKLIGDKGQAGAMGIVVLAISLIIGLYLVGSIYSAVTGTGSTLAGTTVALNTTLNNAVTGFTLMAVAIIVAAAMFILGIMGGR